jgi:glycosyltransferase involved in cell wall biosynthesis
MERTYCPRYAEDLLRRIGELRPAAVVCSHIEIYRYAVHLAQRRIGPIIFDLHNVEYPLTRAIHSMIPPDSPFQDDWTPDYVAQMARAEGAAVAAADEVWVCSDTDRQLLLETYPAAVASHVRVVPNVVRVEKADAPDGGPQRLSFTGRLDYYPNVDAARVLIRDIVPCLDAMGSTPDVVVAGARPSIELRALSLPANVQLIGNPESTADLVRGSIMVIPLTQGGGSRFKILEGFAVGAPVVSTAKGVEGLQVTDGVHYLRAERPEQFATQIRALLADAELRRRLAANAHALVSERYSIQALTAQLSREFHPVPRTGRPVPEPAA